MGKKGGRPSKFTKNLGEKVCDQIADGLTLTEVCRDPKMPHRVTVLRWTRKHEAFRIAYVQARKDQQHIFADEIITQSKDRSRDVIFDETTIQDEDGKTTTKRISKSDNTAVNRDKLICDNMKFLMSRLASEDYGEKAKVEHTGADGGPIKYERLVDKPPKETPQEWQERVRKELQERAKHQIQ